MKIAIILGTRPEIIKMSPVIRVCQKDGHDFFVLHTGQHYDKELDKQIFQDLGLPKPKYNLGVGGKPFRMQVGIMTKEIAKILTKETPDVVLVQGDTISVLAGALAANKLGIKIGHHEAGLRSHDLSMIEEINRVIVDHISDYLFTPTIEASRNLSDEGIDRSKIFLTGNTIVDAVTQNSGIADTKSKILTTLGLKSKHYILATAHRAENVDKENRLASIVEGLGLVSKKTNLPVIFSCHPRTQNNLKRFKITIPKQIRTIKALGFLDFLKLEKNSRLVMTDSGGVQEESFILQVPCVTLRDNTERPDTVLLGANIVSGIIPDKILSSTLSMLLKNNIWQKAGNPFGSGKSGNSIIDILKCVKK